MRNYDDLPLCKLSETKVILIIICNVVHALLNYTPIQSNKLAEAALMFLES